MSKRAIVAWIIVIAMCLAYPFMIHTFLRPHFLILFVAPVILIRRERRASATSLTILMAGISAYYYYPYVSSILYGSSYAHVNGIGFFNTGFLLALLILCAIISLWASLIAYAFTKRFAVLVWVISSFAMIHLPVLIIAASFS